MKLDELIQSLIEIRNRRYNMEVRVGYHSTKGQFITTDLLDILEHTNNNLIDLQIDLYGIDEM